MMETHKMAATNMRDKTRPAMVSGLDLPRWVVELVCESSLSLYWASVGKTSVAGSSDDMVCACKIV